MQLSENCPSLGWRLHFSEAFFLLNVVMDDVFLASPSVFITPTAAAPSVNGEESPTQTYTGTVVLMNGQRYILRDDENNTWYHLDDQNAPNNFSAKKSR